MRILLILFFTVFGFSGFAQNDAYYNQLFDSVSANNKQKEGITYFESELKKFPKNESILRSLGALHFQMGNYSETKNYYAKALAVNPKCAKCYTYLAQVEADGNNFKCAYEFIEKGIAADPKESSLYLLRGKLKIYDGNEISGLNDLSKAILIAPNDAACYIGRAKYYAGKGNYFSAKRDLEKAGQIAPKSLEVYNYLAMIYSAEKDFSKALVTINKALEINASDIQSLLTRGEVYFSNEEYLLAIADYQRVIQLDSTDYRAHFYLGNANYELEKIDEFCTSLVESIRLMEEQKLEGLEFYKYALDQRKEICDSSVASYYYQKGIAAYNLKDYRGAVSWYNRTIEKFPDECAVYSFRGNAELFLDENRKAIESYQKCTGNLDRIRKEISRDSRYVTVSEDSLDVVVKGFEASAYISLAFCYFNLEQTDSALICLNRAILVQPKLEEFSRGDSHLLKGILLLDKGLFYEAEKSFEEAAKRSPDWSVCQDYIALAIISQTKNSSLSRNKVLMKNLDSFSDFHWVLSDKTLKGISTLEQAATHLNKALKIYPDDFFALYLRGYVNRQMRMDYCSDFLKANQLGYPVELVYLKECR